MRVAEVFVKVLGGEPGGPKPNLRLGLGNSFELRASGEMQQVGLRASGMSFAVGIGRASVENKTNRFQPRLREFFRSLEVTNAR
jgi:hypothetical protein